MYGTLEKFREAFRGVAGEDEGKFVGGGWRDGRAWI
ncbi:MAG: hypothetical protein ACJAQT_002474 [Akkermansiaceae bacterium]|jgi:hypothetical protein